MVLLHGYTGNRTHMVGEAELLHEAGIGSLMYDARGCGESDGEMISMGYYETRVWPEDTRRLFAAARQPKTLWLIPGADHEDLQGVAPDDYRARVLDFIGRYFSSP